MKTGERQMIAMKHFKITKENGCVVPCISEIPDGCGKIVIMIHGICSSKESESVKFIMGYMPQRGIGVVAYDQPGHGSEEAENEELRVGSCLDSLEAVEKYVRREYPSAEICYFGSSYGGYILGLYLKKRKHSGKKAFMRCSAVVFPQMVLGDPDSEPDPHSIQELDEKGCVTVDLKTGDTAEFTKGFLEDLRQNDLAALFRESLPDADLAFVHGENDSVVPAGAVKSFAEEFGFPITVVPDEGHTISDHERSPYITAEKAYELFTK
ncbi:MAG: alpha/beta hydrolase [Anaerovoracaceae bacterium]|jgi:pimeloyl-ACP methyl ester carboxylesterase